MRKMVLAALAASISYTPAMAFVATQSVFTASNGDTLRLSQATNEDPGPNYYSANVFIDQATGIFAPFATLPTTTESYFFAFKYGQVPIIHIRSTQLDGISYDLGLTFNDDAFGPSAISNFNYTSVFCENYALQAQRPLTCVVPSQIKSAEVSYIVGAEPTDFTDLGPNDTGTSIFQQQVTGTAVSGPFGTAPAAVPELTSWVMMISGFGAIGATLRRRKVTASFA